MKYIKQIQLFILLISSTNLSILYGQTDLNQRQSLVKSFIQQYFKNRAFLGRISHLERMSFLENISKRLLKQSEKQPEYQNLLQARSIIDQIEKMGRSNGCYIFESGEGFYRDGYIWTGDTAECKQIKQDYDEAIKPLITASESYMNSPEYIAHTRIFRLIEIERLLIIETYSALTFPKEKSEIEKKIQDLMQKIEDILDELELSDFYS